MMQVLTYIVSSSSVSEYDQKQLIIGNLNNCVLNVF